MSLSFILFFTSLVCIMIMIGRKLVLIRKGLVLSTEEVLFEVPHLEKIKHLTIKNIKKYEHISLVIILRFYIRLTNSLKYEYGEIKNKIKNRSKEGHINSEKKEISKFLKIISDYKHKIRAIKHKIHEEEKNL